MPLPWQKSKPATLPTIGQPVSGQLNGVLFRACQEPTCPHYQEPRTGPTQPCIHAENVDLGVMASFQEAAQQVAAYQATGTDSAIVAAARKWAAAVDDLEREGGEHGARVAEYAQQLYFEVKLTRG